MRNPRNRNAGNTFPPASTRASQQFPWSWQLECMAGYGGSAELQAEDWEARRRRVQALAKSGIPAEKALRQIIAHLEDADEQVRRCALDAGVRLLIPPPPTEDMEPEEAAAACAARLAAQQSALGRELRGSVLKQLKSDK
ncbi:unnamed protein product, partial [Effrenium voratum]